MRIALTGANGFIGRRLTDRAVSAGHNVHLLLRRPQAGLAPGVAYSLWDALGNEPPASAFEGADAVIHLAGEPVAQRWTEDVKKRIVRSRTVGTQRLVQALSVLREKPRVLVSASAIGYYGSRGDELLTESSSAGGDFLADVAEQWENAALLAASLGIRVVTLRIGIVLGRGGGALQQMLLPFRLGAGGRLGDGQQWMSWIHVDDIANLILTAATDERYRGPVNAVGPNPVRNEEFTQTLARTLRRPAIFPVPEFALRLIYGEMAKVVMASQRVDPRVARSNGFAFAFPDLGPALRDLLK
jgi:uncharacterized protein (TIGR01777 family)